MNVLTVTMGTLVDRALAQVRSPKEYGRVAALPVSLASGAVTTTLLVPGTTLGANPTDMLEIDSELVLVTIKSTDPDPIYTLIRAWGGTVAVSHAAGAAVQINPTFTRRQAAEGVRQAFRTIEALGVPLLVSAVVLPVVDAFGGSRNVISLPEIARKVWSVRSGLARVPRCELVEDLPTAIYPTGQVVWLPTGVGTTDSLHITYSVPYRWSTFPADPTEASTISLPEGAEDLPALYSAGVMLSGREVSRHELDRSEEWAQTEPVKAGASGAVVRAKWQEFYRALDEAKRLDAPLPTRPYRRWAT